MIQMRLAMIASARSIAHTTRPDPTLDKTLGSRILAHVIGGTARSCRHRATGGERRQRLEGSDSSKK